MHKQQLSKRSRTRLAPLACVALLILSLCLMLTGCDGHFLSLDCVGSSGFCSSLQPTPTNALTLQATTGAIIAHPPLTADPLNKPDGYNWPVSTACRFHDDAYYIQYSGRSAGNYTCFSNKIKYQNVAIALNVTLFKGDAAGIAFRASQKMNTFYDFLVSQAQFALVVMQGNTLLSTVPVPNPRIHGMGLTNRLMVIARGDDFQFFINGSFITEMHDKTISAAGYIGLSLVYRPLGEASFSDLDIYQI